MTVTDNQWKTYRGNCHCAAFVYEVKYPEIKSASACNCSICTKKGTLWIMPKHENFKIVKGLESDLTSYTFGSGQMIHKFCGNCGTAILVDFPNGPPGGKLAVNVRSIQDLDVWGLEISPFNGASYGKRYQLPEHKGANPTAKVEDGALYTGSCHCGDLTIAVNSEPIDETYKGMVIDCNCSICVRNGYIWIYPQADQVVLTGADDKMGKYSFNHSILYKTFCKRCGVPMTNHATSLSAEDAAALPEDRRFWYDLAQGKHAVNTRVLHGMDIYSLQPRQVDGKAEHKPAYVNP
ncbi:Centromere protein V [Colletotrichum trifolii]|uniref:Centromere protein V n=1 Tax=Colletotrichum trifolii TaxID=5466 RepID=A0A4R8RGQ7_COLTR|nr:Centromere protein V [Colletotrichum trifolii]